MGTLLYANDKIALAELNNWWNTNVTLTEKDFREFLIQKHPNYEWTQLYVSKILFKSNIPYSIEESNKSRIYYSPHMNATIIRTSCVFENQILDTEEEFKIIFAVCIEDLRTNNFPITKKAIKVHLKELGWILGQDYSSEQFERYFKESNLRWNGQLNQENHRIYNIVSSGQHYSTSSAITIDIKEIHPNYIYNILKKKYPKVKLIDCFNRNSEVYHLLKNYFTYDMRQVVKELIDK